MSRQWKNRIAFVFGALLNGLIFIFVDQSFLAAGIVCGGMIAVLVVEGIL